MGKVKQGQFANICESEKNFRIDIFYTKTISNPDLIHRSTNNFDGNRKQFIEQESFQNPENFAKSRQQLVLCHALF